MPQYKEVAMRFYQLLLRLFPKSFRNEYGAEMETIFQHRGPRLLWIGTILDVLVDAISVHLDILRQDLRYTMRSLREAPGFALTAIGVLAIGIGATTAVFSMTNHVLLRPLPFRDSPRLVDMYSTTPGYRNELSPANYRDWRRMSTSFDEMAAWRGLSVNLVGQGEPQRVGGASLTFDMLPMLGSQPLKGRIFDENDDRAVSAGTVLLSYRLWMNVFAGDPNIIDKLIHLDGEVYMVVGVMPANFFFPNRDAQLWTAMRFVPEDFAERTNNYIHVIGKLKPSLSLQK